jgi:hypothetical protein
LAVAQRDKYALSVPGGLAFSEFRGFEAWPVVSVSHDGDLLAAILANPLMIDAYRAGIPGNGKLFPDGAKMAKIHWNPKKMETFPSATVPATQHDVDFMVKDQRHGRSSNMTPRPIRSRPGLWLTGRRGRTTPSAGSRATRS